MSQPNHTDAEHQSTSMKRNTDSMTTGQQIFERKNTYMHDVDEIDEHNSTTADDTDDLNAGSLDDSSVTTGQPIAEQSSRIYIVQPPYHIWSCHEEIERKIKNSLKDIEENNEILRGIQLLKPRKVEGVTSRRVSEKPRLQLGKLGQVVIRCEEITQEWDQHKHKYCDELKQEYENKICDYLQEQLNVTFNIRSCAVRDNELGDIMFYYITKGEEPDKHVKEIIHNLHHPLYDHTDSWENISWYELCCVALISEKTFTQFYKRLDNNKTALEYLLYKRPQLLLNKKSYILIDRLIEHLPDDNLHQIMTNIRDKNGQTTMFYIGSRIPKLYINHIDNLYKLLSIRNTTGQTVLHVNTETITDLLAETYTPKQRDAFIKLTSITDNNNQTALQVSNRDNLRSLIYRVKNNKYIVRSKFNTHILIIDNTNNREGAEEEALTIYNACKWKYRNITLKKNKSGNELIDYITRSANKDDIGSLIVILMSRGSFGTIDDYHGNPIKLSDIEAAMCSNILDGRPKMLITHCCQIGAKSIETTPYVPTHGDFCAVMSCVAGEESRRGVFLGKLAEHIKNSKKDTEILNIVGNVCKEMDREGHYQIPIILSTLEAHFCPTDDWSSLDQESHLWSSLASDQESVLESDPASDLEFHIDLLHISETQSSSSREERATDSKLSLKAAITPAKLTPPRLKQKKCIKPDEILFYLIDKKIDVEMVRFGKIRESYEIFMNCAQWAGIEEEFHQHFKRDPPLDIVLQGSDDCGVVTELCGYTNSGVRVSIGKESSDGKVSLILLKSERKPFMLMMAHVLRDLKELKRHLGEVVWENMWSLKSGNFSKDSYIAVIEALNTLLDKQDLKIELNYPEQQANQPNGKDSVTIFGTKIVGLVYDVVADKPLEADEDENEEEDWDEKRNSLPPDNLPTAFLACDAALIQLDINSSTIPATRFQDFDRIRIANNELRRISNIFEVHDLADVTWTRIATKPLFCADLRLDVQMPPTSEARRAPEFGPRSMWKPRLITEPLITEPDDVTSTRLYADGHSGMISVRENDDENDRSVSAVGALHSDVRKMRQLYFIPIWHQLRAMKYLPEYDLLVPENEYFLINQDRPIDFSSHITEAQTRIEQPALASDCRSPDDIDEPETNP